MVRELGIAALAEGIEVEEEHEVCRQVGFEFAQGYLYGKPALPKSFASRAAAASSKSTIVSMPC